MAANIQAQAGQGQISLFEVESNYDTKKSTDISNSILEFTYYESILDHTIRATATFADTGHRSNGEGSAVVEEGDANLTTGEKVNLKISDGNNTKLDFVKDNHFRIQKVRDIDESTNKIVYTLDLWSKECIDNELERCRVKKRYDGKISNHIENILKEVLKTPKKLDIDTTLNNLNVVGAVAKPFYKCAWLGPRSVPDISKSQGNLAGFLFYETYEGYKFKSIDKLFQQKPKKNYIFNNIIGTVPPGYDGKILEYSFDHTIDFKNSLLTGSLMKTKLKVVNPYESSYRENEFGHEKQFNTDNTGGKEAPKIASDLNISDEVTRIYYKWDDAGFLPEGKNLDNQLEKSKQVNYNNDEILRQSTIRYNNLFMIKLSATIAGDFSLRAGDLIHCDFPEVSSKSNTTYSNKKSGIYMIADVCHRITKNSCYTRLNLVRDSIGRKPFKR